MNVSNYSTAKYSSTLDVLVGTQWGDEGKGKWIDFFAAKADIIARFQGGANAGHTLIIEDTKMVLHQLPSGLCYDNSVNILGAGMVVDPVKLLDEISEFKKNFPDLVISKDRLKISKQAHVVTPWNIYIDNKQEEAKSVTIGTTKRGIGPTYADKANRIGLRIVDFVNIERLQNWLKTRKEQDQEFAEHYESNAEEWNHFLSCAEYLNGFVENCEHYLRQNLNNNKKILLEGAQATLLDLSHGTYPFVTSSSTTSGGAVQSLGLPPKSVNKVIGIAKAYATRVGTGPFPSELTNEIGDAIAQKGNEFGATTGRARRCGWLDLVALKYAVEVNGIDELIINKLDILENMAEIKLVTSYKTADDTEIDFFLCDAEELSEVRPVYKSFQGYADIPRTGKIENLPENAKKIISFISDYCRCEITMIGTGPSRTDYLSL